MADNEVKPLDLSKMKSTSARIDLSAAAPAPGIRLSTPPAGVSSRIEISPVPGVAPSAGLQPAAVDEDIYKRRTALLDTSKIPMATGAAPAAPAAAAPSAAIPRTVRIGARPTIRIGGAQAPSTFTPGREEEGGAAAAPAAAKPAIRLKRPGGVTVSAAASSTPALGGGAAGDGFVLNQQDDDEPGTVWAVVALLGLLVTGALIYFQIMTMQGAAY